MPKVVGELACPECQGKGYGRDKMKKGSKMRGVTWMCVSCFGTGKRCEMCEGTKFVGYAPALREPCPRCQS